MAKAFALRPLAFLLDRWDEQANEDWYFERYGKGNGISDRERDLITNPQGVLNHLKDFLAVKQEIIDENPEEVEYFIMSRDFTQYCIDKVAEFITETGITGNQEATVWNMNW